MATNNAMTGVVVSAKNDKTVVIRIDERRSHPLYSKKYTVSTKFQVHDEDNQATVGDTIEVAAIRPVSKHKKLKLVRVVTKAKGA